MKFAHRIILVCWEGILDVLSVLIGGKSSCGITSSFALMFNAKEESHRAREAICASLDGLQKAARLACILGWSADAHPNKYTASLFFFLQTVIFICKKCICISINSMFLYWGIQESKTVVVQFLANWQAHHV